MIFTMDIGNTNIKTALFNGEDMVAYWRIATDRSKSSDEYGILLANLFSFWFFSIFAYFFAFRSDLCFWKHTLGTRSDIKGVFE